MDFQITKAMGEAQEKMSDTAFQQAGSILDNNRSLVREKFQKDTSIQIKRIIEKLSEQQTISSDEINLIKLWIIGDADSYTKIENNFQDWLDEYDRLKKIIRNYENKDCSDEDLLKLHGILEDAIRVNYDIANFLEKKDRMQKFESAISDGLDKEEREAFIEVLSGKLSSSKY